MGRWAQNQASVTTIPVLWPEPCRGWVRWTEEKKLWIWRSGVILDEGMVSDLVSGVLWSEPCRRWVSELKRRSCESEDLERLWMKEWSLISCQVFSDLNPVEDEWGELKRRSCESEGSGVIMDEGMVSDLVSGVLWPEPCRRWVSELKRRSCESEDLERLWMKEWSLISCQVFSDLNPVEDEWGELKRRSCESEGSGVIMDEGMVSDLVSGVLWPEPCRRWVSELKRRSCESEDLERLWMKEWSLISCQVFSDLNPVEDEWGELKRRSCESEGSGVIMDEGMVSDLVSGVLWPEPCRGWVRWTEEKKLWIWRIWSDSGWRKQSLISYQVFSKLFRHDRRQLRAVTLGKGRCSNWVPIIVANAFISQRDFPLLSIVLLQW